MRRHLATRKRWLSPGVGAGLLFLLAFGTILAQRVIEMKGFKFAEYYPQKETQMKSLLEGARAQPLTNGLVRVHTARLQTFRENGEAEINVEAPECVHDPNRRTINSPGPLHVRTADGKFSIEGQGFLWQQTNSVLVISNQVRTLIDASLLEHPGDAEASSPTADSQPMQVTSDRFDYSAETGEGLYRGDVRVTGTNSSLASRVLRLKLPMKERQLQSITAEEEVFLDYGGMKASGQKAVYDLRTELVHVSGKPEWRGEGRQGSADEFILDRTNRTVHALGHAWLRLPAPKGAGGGLLASSSLPLSGSGTERSIPDVPNYIEIVSRNYDLRTNSGIFRGPIEMKQLEGERVSGEMTCSAMEVTFAATNELQTLSAEEDVVIQQKEGDRRFTAARALYTATNGVLRLTGNPQWRAGERQGKGDLLLVNSQRNEMVVTGNASMQVPASELGQTSPPLPAGAMPDTADSTQTADIFSEEYTFRSEQAVFRGGVYISHPRMWLGCQELTVLSPTDSAKTNTITAERNVSFDMMDERGQKIQGQGQKAIYTFTKGGETNDVLHLTGDPMLQTTNGTFRNKIIILDRAHNKVYAPGRYALRGSAQALGTNTFRLPSTRFKR